MSPEEYIKLYQKYVAGGCTPEEEAKLFSYTDNFEVWDSSTDEKDNPEEKLLRKKIYHRIIITTSSKEIKLRMIWLKYAAIVIIALSVGVVSYVSNIADKKNDRIDLSHKTKIIADSSGVMLTLSDGSVIPIDSRGDGLLSAEGSVKINKTGAGEIVYDGHEELITEPIAFNKLYIPSQMQYKLILSDGTRVWLNANSTLYYPSTFKGSERNVELLGEAYFEVAKNENMPFVVKTLGMRVKVLGTHFNISAYEEDSFEKTTLIEGSVKVSNRTQSVILKPGQQGVTGAIRDIISVSQADLQQVTAWKNGYFLFKNADLKEIMEQISRWYNVDVVYNNTTEKKSFGGIFSRSKQLEELLKSLELTGTVKFKVEGRKIYVMD